MDHPLIGGVVGVVGLIVTVIIFGACMQLAAKFTKDEQRGGLDCGTIIIGIVLFILIYGGLIKLLEQIFSSSS